MDLAPAATATPIVIPGYFTCAGVLLYAAIMAGIVGFARDRSRLHLTFAATCLCSAGATFSIASYYLADSLPAALGPLHAFGAWAVLLLFSLFSFVATYAEVPRQGPGFVVLGAAAALMLAANAVMPYGIWFRSVGTVDRIELPWGETIFHAQGVPSPWNLGVRILSVAIVAWGVWRLLARHRPGDRRGALLLAGYLVMLLAASVEGALIDFGVLRTFHWIGAAFVGLAVLVGIDLAIRLRAQDTAIRAQAWRDALTGMPNRFALQDRLQRMGGPRGARGFGAVVQLDLDHFKVVNDALSHEVGDRLLQEAARRIATACGDRALAARVGGDEFMAMLAAACESEAQAAERIRALERDIAGELARPFTLGEQVLGVSASAGMATFELGVEPREVLSRAALAVHEAKKRGRHQVQAFMPELQREAEAKFRVVEGLGQAIAADLLELHYQPQVDREGRVAGVEALVRWNRGPGAPRSPAEFIPVAEETGLIHALGEWTLVRGCAQLAAWTRDGPAPGGAVSINVSPWQLARPGFVERLAQIVAASGIDARGLMLEITESAALYDLADTVARLKEIRATGVRIALDDFGTGYSSLSLLKDLPLDAIKIDQSFVRHIDVGANRHLVRVVVAIGQELGIDVVAEGIETERERSVLFELGCRKLQGYLVCRPLPAAELAAWLARRSAQASAA